MLSRVKYYRRRKAEYLQQRRRIKNFNYFLYMYTELVRKNYLRLLKFQNSINYFEILKSKNKLLFYSKKRRDEIDDYESDVVSPKKYPSVGLYYIPRNISRRQWNLINIFGVIDSFKWNNNSFFSNSLKKQTKRRISKAYNVKRVVKLSRILSTNFIRMNYAKIFRMDRLKFPIINYIIKTKTIKTFYKYNYYFRKMGGLFFKRKLWLKKMGKNTLWKYARIIKLKLLNKIKIIITKTYNNFYITALKRNKQVIIGYSAGCSGLQGSKRLSPLSAEKVAKKFINKFFEKVAYFANVDIYVNSYKLDASIRNILNILLRAKKIQYSKIFKRRILIRLITHKLIMATKLSHNGVRKRHPRRV
jgi:ribosomal protein S11